jgi:hypothetical protein
LARLGIYHKSYIIHNINIVKTFIRFFPEFVTTSA